MLRAELEAVEQGELVLESEQRVGQVWQVYGHVLDKWWVGEGDVIAQVGCCWASGPNSDSRSDGEVSYKF